MAQSGSGAACLTEVLSGLIVHLALRSPGAAAADTKKLLVSWVWGRGRVCGSTGPARLVCQPGLRRWPHVPAAPPRRDLSLLAPDIRARDLRALHGVFDCGDLADDEHRSRLAADELDRWEWVP